MILKIAVVHNTHSAQILSALTLNGERFELYFIENPGNVCEGELSALKELGANVVLIKNPLLRSLYRLALCLRFGFLGGSSICYLSNPGTYGSLIWRAFFKDRLATMDEGAFNWVCGIDARINRKKAASRFFRVVHRLGKFKDDEEFMSSSVAHYSFLALGPLAQNENFKRLNYQPYLKFAVSSVPLVTSELKTFLESSGLLEKKRVILFFGNGEDSNLLSSYRALFEGRFPDFAIKEVLHPSLRSAVGSSCSLSAEVLTYYLATNLESVYVVSTSSSVLFSTTHFPRVVRYTLLRQPSRELQMAFVDAGVVGMYC